MCKKQNETSAQENAAEEIALEFVSSDNLLTDPLGSYTGTPADEAGEVPTQDVDDL